MDARRAWLLNFDADDELRDPGYTSSIATRKRLRQLEGRVGPLLAPGDVALFEGDEVKLGSQFAGRAWCPTPRALEALGKAGVKLPSAPSFEVLRRVNHRRFAAELGLNLPGSRYAERLEDVHETMRAPSPTGLWLLRTPHGFAGRGARRMRLEEAEGALRRWIEGKIASEGGLLVEPWVERNGDYGLHGFVEAGGTTRLGQATVQECDERGIWRSSRAAMPAELSEQERHELLEAAQQAADALHAAGYFGPFGVDAFRWRDEKGRTAFNPRCEINARYSMGWAVGMGKARPDL